MSDFRPFTANLEGGPGQTHFCLGKLDIAGSEFLALKQPSGAPPLMLMEVHIAEGAKVLKIQKDRDVVWQHFVTLVAEAGYTIIHQKKLSHFWQDPIVLLGRPLRGPEKACKNCVRRSQRWTGSASKCQDRGLLQEVLVPNLTVKEALDIECVARIKHLALLDLPTAESARSRGYLTEFRVRRAPEELWMKEASRRIKSKFEMAVRMCTSLDRASGSNA